MPRSLVRKPVHAATAALVLSLAGGGCASQSSAPTPKPHARTPAVHAPIAPAAAVKHVSSAPLVTAPGAPARGWAPVAMIAGRAGAWIAQRAGVTLLRFDQSLVHLALHAGSGEPGGGGWSYGDQIGPREVHRVVAGFNGGFKLSYGSVGFMSGGRIGAPLKAGLASIVTYKDGTTQIGAWRNGVPARGHPIGSVLQNQRLLVDHGEPASTLESCVQTCWGSTLGGGTEVPRSALGITSNAQLVWAAGESLSPLAIAKGLSNAGVQRAVELDINPAWVAGYLYMHRREGPTAVPVVPGQVGIPGQLLAPYSRDFFTILAN
jgi:hypothetical protein